MQWFYEEICSVQIKEVIWKSAKIIHHKINILSLSFTNPNVEQELN